MKFKPKISLKGDSSKIKNVCSNSLLEILNLRVQYAEGTTWLPLPATIGSPEYG